MCARKHLTRIERAKRLLFLPELLPLRLDQVEWVLLPATRHRPRNLRESVFRRNARLHQRDGWIEMFPFISGISVRAFRSSADVTRRIRPHGAVEQVMFQCGT